MELKNEFEVLNSNIDNLEVTCNPSNLTWNDRTWKLHDLLVKSYYWEKVWNQQRTTYASV